MARRFRRDGAGTASIEFAFVALPLATLLFACIEFGLAMRAKSALQYATVQAARCSVVRPTICGTQTTVNAYAQTQLQGMTMAPVTFTYTNEDCGHRVIGVMPFPVVSHSVFPASFSLSAVACYPL